MPESKRPTSSLPPAGHKRGEIHFHFRGPSVIQATWIGYIDLASCAHYPAELNRILFGKRIRFAIFDALAVSGFAADSHIPGGQLLAECKRAGAERVIVVTDSSAIRMIGSTVALATGLSIRFVANEADALAIIRSNGVGVI